MTRYDRSVLVKVVHKPNEGPGYISISRVKGGPDEF